MKTVKVKQREKPRTIEVDKVKNVFIGAIKAFGETAYNTQYDIGFQRGLEHGYYLCRSVAGDIKEK